MNKEMYCKKCGNVHRMFVRKTCKFCGSKMELLSEKMEDRYHLYNEDWSDATEEDRSARKNDFVINELLNTSDFSMEAYQKQIRVQREMNKRIADDDQKQLLEQQAKNIARMQRISDKQNCIPKCPICGSSNIKKITITKRAVKTAAFGVYGAVDDAGKTYQCDNCGSKF